MMIEHLFLFISYVGLLLGTIWNFYTLHESGREKKEHTEGTKVDDIALGVSFWIVFIISTTLLILVFFIPQNMLYGLSIQNMSKETVKFYLTIIIQLLSVVISAFVIGLSIHFSSKENPRLIKRSSLNLFFLFIWFLFWFFVFFLRPLILRFAYFN